MSIINCDECGKEISDKAAACPHCGAPATPYINPAQRPKPGDRRCLTCGYTGQMKTWMLNNNTPQVIALVLLLFWVIPGIIFIAWAWGKHKCPRCGKLDNSVQIA